MPISKTSNSVKGYLGRNLPPTSITRLTSQKQSLTLGFCKVSFRIQWKLSSTCVSAEWEVMKKLEIFKWHYKGAVKPVYPSPIFSSHPLAIAISYIGSTITLLSLLFQTLDPNFEIKWQHIWYCFPLWLFQVDLILSTDCVVFPGRTAL